MVNTFKDYRLDSPIDLMRVLPGTENDRRNEYFDENEAIGHPTVAFEMVSGEQAKLDKACKSLRQQGFATMINGIGMAQGKTGDLMESLRDYGAKKPEFTLVRGAESLATYASDYEALVDALSDAGVKAIAYEVTDERREQAIGHSHTVSLGRQAMIADYLSKRIM